MNFSFVRRCRRPTSGTPLLLFSFLLVTFLFYFLVGRHSIYREPRIPEYLSLSRSRNARPAKKSTRPLRVRERKNYVVVSDYVVADESYPLNSSVTLTTQGTYEFLYHVERLCLRWKAPVSVAVYAPGDDFYPAAGRISYLRGCGHPCLKANVTWHLIFDKPHAPRRDDLLKARETPADCRNDSSNFSNFRAARKLTYPINLARNVARTMARTRYVLASDIELYPSLNLVPRFLEMIRRRNANVSSGRVYVLPVFEVEKNSEVPDTKRELLEMMSEKKAVFFHASVCDECHRFPDRNRWLKTSPPRDSVAVFSVVKFSPPWEPFYIGTDDEPPFHEDFTWEGKMNKFPQVLEMCFADYDFCILDNAFLVHSPGIKRIDWASERRRAPYASKNTKLYRLLRLDLIRKYGNKSGCLKRTSGSV